MLDQINNREDQNPHHINEMPVQAEEFHAKVIVFGIFAIKRIPEYLEQPDHADQHMEPVKAGQGKERGTERPAAQKSALHD